MESLLIDPIVAEIHATRQAHAASFGFDVQRIIADLKLAEQARTGWPLVRLVRAPVAKPAAPALAAHAD